MSLNNRWLLPDGVDELLPPEAWTAESMRRAILDNFSSYGYDLVTPPLIEYLDSLLTGTGNNLDLQTFKLTDQLTGRMMGVRADITPQAARIDAHLLKNRGVSRLCYADTVLHTRPAHMMASRSPMQIGCELFGESDQAADLEIISLMLETLAIAGIENIHIDLAHVGIYRGLIESSGLKVADEARLFDALSRKSIPELDALAANVKQGNDVINIIRDIAGLSGGAEALDRIRESVKQLNAQNVSGVMSAIDELASDLSAIKKRFPGVEIGFDFCELRGYDYHTGVMFAAYTPGVGDALAKGGRYDDIGKDFGQPRPATGFSADLKNLVRISSGQGRDHLQDVVAPAGDNQTLLNVIKDLRKNRRVVQRLSEADTGNHNCGMELVELDGEWQVRPIAI
ncbi:MAG: ATP phosphoribosyltransferase regulatory subunit [Oleiphilus sp.]|nr:MAG: ATP phosphoribosyltransferase regulatory subunit [Oleiphilus sp.]